MNRLEAVNALRAIANLLETNSELESNRYGSISIYVPCESKEALAAFARAVGHTRKGVAGHVYYLSHMIRPDAEIWAGINRDHVCERVVKTRIVPATAAVPAMPEREVEEVEWICDDPILENNSHA